MKNGPTDSQTYALGQSDCLMPAGLIGDGDTKTSVVKDQYKAVKCLVHRPLTTDLLAIVTLV